MSSEGRYNLQMSIILGIDPGSRITGYGLIMAERQQYRFVHCGTIKCTQQKLSERLTEIYKQMTALIEEFQPQMAAIEKVFVSRNVDSALKLGQARGAAIVACCQQQIELSEYSPREIKQAIVGYGNADKNQIQQMTSRILNIAVQTADAADALAIAICHANYSQALVRTNQISEKVL